MHTCLTLIWNLNMNSIARMVCIDLYALVLSITISGHVDGPAYLGH